jgi:hypothetical protein
MALTTLAYVCDVMRTKKYSNWRLKCDGALVNLHEGKDVEMAISELKKCVNNQIGGLIEVTISNKTGAEKNEGGDIKNNSLSFNIEAKKAINGNTDNNDENNGESKVESLYQKLAEQKYLFLIQQLEKENEDLKQQITDLENEEEEEEPINGIGAILDELRPYIKPMIGKFLGGAMPLQTPAAINEDVSKEPTPGSEKLTDEQIEQIKKCAAGGKKILLIDKYFGDRVLQLALLAEKDFASYEMACNMLNSMAQKLQGQP